MSRFVGLLALLAVACGSGTSEAPPSTSPPAAADTTADPTPAPTPIEPEATEPAEVVATGDGEPAAAAQKIWATLCATCHGEQGLGDGPAAQHLDPPPRNYTDAAWQASVTDEHLAKVIVEGGMAVGLAPIMPPNPTLTDKPDVVAELVKIVRGFGAAD
jgi:cytochrome c553